MDQSHHKIVFHILISQMEHVFGNNTSCGCSSTHGIVTAMITLYALPVKKVYPITTQNGTCMKGGCKVAILKGWALHSPET